MEIHEHLSRRLEKLKEIEKNLPFFKKEEK